MALSRRGFLECVAGAGVISLFSPSLYGQEPKSASLVSADVAGESELDRNELKVILDASAPLEQRLAALDSSSNRNPQAHLEFLDKKFTKSRPEKDASLLVLAALEERARHIRFLDTYWATVVDVDGALDELLAASSGYASHSPWTAKSNGSSVYLNATPMDQFFWRMHATEMLGFAFERANRKRLPAIVGAAASALDDTDEMVAVEGLRTLAKALPGYGGEDASRSERNDRQAILNKLYALAMERGDPADPRVHHCMEHALWTYRSIDDVGLWQRLESAEKSDRVSLAQRMLGEEPRWVYQPADCLDNVHDHFLSTKESDIERFLRNVQGPAEYRDSFIQQVQLLKEVQPKLYHFVGFVTTGVQVGVQTGDSFAGSGGSVVLARGGGRIGYGPPTDLVHEAAHHFTKEVHERNGGHLGEERSFEGQLRVVIVPDYFSALPLEYYGSNKYTLSRHLESPLFYTDYLRSMLAAKHWMN